MEEENLESSSPERVSKSKRPARNVKKPGTSIGNRSGESSGNAKWSQKEIKIITDGLKELGVTRYSRILDQLPNRRLMQFKSWLWKVSRDAYKLKAQEREVESILNKEEAEDSSLGAELVSSEKNKNPSFCFRSQAAITKSLLFIENLEQHPKMKSNQDINFKQLYNALFMAMKGYPLPNMNEATLRFFYKSFQNLLGASSGNLIESFPIENCEALERLAENSNLNPLSLHIECLKARINFGSSDYETIQNMKDWVSPSDWNCL